MSNSKTYLFKHTQSELCQTLCQSCFVKRNDPKNCNNQEVAGAVKLSVSQPRPSYAAKDHPSSIGPYLPSDLEFFLDRARYGATFDQK